MFRDKFFSNKVHLPHVLLLVGISVLVFVIAGFVFWFTLIYLPAEKNIAEHQRLEEMLKKLYASKGIPFPTSSASQ